MDSVQHPDIDVRRYILEAAGRDPRYLPLLPGLFTVSDSAPYTNAAENLYALFDAEAKYPADLRHFFNPCLMLDPRGITPFLPYAIRGDLVSLLDNDNNPPFTSEDIMGESNAPKNVGSNGLGGSASNEDDHSPALAPEMDPQSSDPPYHDDDFDLCQDFKTTTIRDVIATFFLTVACLMCFIFIMAYFAPFSFVID